MITVNQIKKEIEVLSKWLEENKEYIPKEVHGGIVKELNRKYSWLERMDRIPKKTGAI